MFHLPVSQPRRLRSNNRLPARVVSRISYNRQTVSEKMRNEKSPGQERPASLKRKIADRLCNTKENETNRQEQILNIAASMFVKQQPLDLEDQKLEAVVSLRRQE